ncbi:hypothetical protein [Microbulbifer yueqingensis]|uniref:Uncharacterized protein n=1 Tax=Microbulbifer yueqingensis TaxID=658219 RepID=A0A1G8UZR9_9GAMM|nr:hypothetical protein [Microbulbifer yueqingensis]SDJ59293.1 hypothetical protein SAMN05216212_0344 [Microbulbifer yueqingensis]
MARLAVVLFLVLLLLALAGAIQQCSKDDRQVSDEAPTTGAGAD